MTAYRERFYTSSDGLQLYYRDYENASPRLPVLCIPGLTRNSRDFGFIAAHLAKTRRVLTADLRGRGRSAHADWRTYAVPLEAADMTGLLEDACAPRVVVLGTSRGGIIGMMMATFPGVVAGLILNDIGADLAPEGLQRILDTVGTHTPQPNWTAAAESVRARNAFMFPDLDEPHWLTLARGLYREEREQLVPDYDLKLRDAMWSGRVPGRGRMDLWPLFEAVLGAPMLVLRGEHSDLLSAETLQRMQDAKPDLQTVTVRDRGHVPFLDEPEAVDAIERFLGQMPLRQFLRLDARV
jgi:pimeloyl-ACP methyl ester carboxylesterase